MAGILMISASVYGVAEYNKKAGTQEFKELYTEKKEPVTLVEKTEMVVTNDEKPVVKKVELKKAEKATTKREVIKKKIKKDTKGLRTKMFSRARPE